MSGFPSTDDAGLDAGDSLGLGPLFHRLNNQLGVVLANAELLEARTSDHAHRRRATQVVAGVLDAMGTARAIRMRAESLIPSTDPQRIL
jgi:hypothetical protein